MKNTLLLLTLITLVFSSCSTNEPSQPKEEWLFVHTAEGAQVLNSTSIVMPLMRDIFAFTDRPYRKHVYWYAEQFTSLWKDTISNSFKNDPPNAVLTWVDGKEIKELEVVITDAISDGRSITYTISDNAVIKKGNIEHASLFVDAVTTYSPRSSIALEGSIPAGMEGSNEFSNEFIPAEGSVSPF